MGEGGDGRRGRGRLRPRRRPVSGCGRLSEVDADNGLLDMPGLILSPLGEGEAVKGGGVNQ